MTKRLEWIDALRGMTMILVVANHISGFGFCITGRTSALMELTLLFRMPLFFFVSGFLVYKANERWSLKSFGEKIVKKCRVQIVPTIFFLLVFSCVKYKTIWIGLSHAFESPTKGGYWFTIALLYLFVIYYVVAFVEDKTKQRWLIFVVFALSLVGYEMCYMPQYFSFHKTEFMKRTSFSQIMLFSPYFFFGVIVKRYWERMQRLFDSRLFFPIMAIVAFVCCVEYMKWHHLRLMWANLPRTIAIYSLVMCIVMIFRHYEYYVSKATRLGRALQFVGKRTLDIYLIHYLFFPNLPEIGKWIDAHKLSFVLELVLSLGYGLLVVALCLLVSAALRTSPFFKKWLFGRS